MKSRAIVAAVVLTIGAAGVGSGCGGLRQSDEPRAPASETAADDGAATIGTNDFIPENVNLGDCVSSMPRPNCGSASRGGYHELLTFGVLMLGMAFIGWRIFRGVRKRDSSAV